MSVLRVDEWPGFVGYLGADCLFESGDVLLAVGECLVFGRFLGGVGAAVGASTRQCSLAEVLVALGSRVVMLCRLH